jgi:hypothetical protein
MPRVRATGKIDVYKGDLGMISQAGTDVVILK